MIGKWINSLLGRISPETLQQGAIEEAKQRKKTERLIDVAHEVMTEEAQRRHAELEGLVRSGWPTVKRERVKQRVRQKVWEVVRRDFHLSDAEMVEEITERIVDAAEVDPVYEQVFSKE